MMNLKTVKKYFFLSFLSLILLGSNALAASRGFVDPLGGLSLENAIVKIIRFLLGLVGGLAMLGIVVGAIYMIVSFGNDQRLALGKKIVFWSLGGLAVALLSFVFIQVMGELLGFL